VDEAFNILQHLLREIRVAIAYDRAIAYPKEAISSIRATTHRLRMQGFHGSLLARVLTVSAMLAACSSGDGNGGNSNLSHPKRQTFH
jgi:hypothetical protein